MQALEAEVGGRLFERTPAGVQLTAAGHLLADTMRPAVAAYERGMAEVSQLLRHGERQTLRIGYLVSVAQAYLNPALAALRRTHPQVRVVLHNLFPAEQIDWLRRGEIDVALVGQEGRIAEREFYMRKLATLPLVVILPADHPLAARGSVRLAELQSERFVHAPEEQLPGRDCWVTQLCRAAGFRARFGTAADDLSHALSLVASEGLALLGPAIPQGYPGGNVRIVLRSPCVYRETMHAFSSAGKATRSLPCHYSLTTRTRRVAGSFAGSQGEDDRAKNRVPVTRGCCLVSRRERTAKGGLTVGS